jgi:hypothetical protein
VHADQAPHDQLDVPLPIAGAMQGSTRRGFPPVRSPQQHCEELRWQVPQVRSGDRGPDSVVKRLTTTNHRHASDGTRCPVCLITCASPAALAYLHLMTATWSYRSGGDASESYTPGSGEHRPNGAVVLSLEHLKSPSQQWRYYLR